MKKILNQFLYAPDEPMGSPIVESVAEPEEVIAEEPEEVQEPEEETFTAAQWAEKNPPAKPQPQRQAPTQNATPEIIEGTRIVKPENYDEWGLDKQMAYIAETTAYASTQVNQAATRAARDIEKSAEDWFKPYLETVISDCDPRYLASADEDQRQGLIDLAMGRAMRDGKSPTPTSKPVPGASPTSSRQTPQGAPSSEVSQVLKGIKDAGYDRVADSPVIKAILAGAN